MKKIIVTGLTFIVVLNSFAQYEKDKDETKEKGFKKENLFTAGVLYWVLVLHLDTALIKLLMQA